MKHIEDKFKQLLDIGHLLEEMRRDNCHPDAFLSENIRVNGSELERELDKHIRFYFINLHYLTLGDDAYLSGKGKGSPKLKLMFERIFKDHKG